MCISVDISVISIKLLLVLCTKTMYLGKVHTYESVVMLLWHTAKKIKNNNNNNNNTSLQ